MNAPFKIPPKQASVLVVTPYYPAHGGMIEHAAGHLISEIAATDNLHFTWAASSCDSAPNGPNQVAVPMRGTNMLEPLTGFRYPIWMPKSMRQLQHLVQGSDLLWLHDTIAQGSVAAFKAAQKAGKPILITQQEAPGNYRNPLYHMAEKYLRHKFTEKMLRQAKQVTFTSDAVADYYYRRLKFSAPVKIIPNGFDPRVFHTSLTEKRNYLRARFALRDNQPVLLFAGRFTNSNGLQIIRRLAQAFPTWRFWLAGNGPVNPDGWYLNNVQSFRNRVETGLAELYQAADLLIMPGFTSEFPIAIQQAMACGLPVLCSTTIAAANHQARPHLFTVPSDPRNFNRTLYVWREKLKSMERRMPLEAPYVLMTELAQNLWEWPKIAGYYGDILRILCKAKAPFEPEINDVKDVAA